MGDAKKNSQFKLFIKLFDYFFVIAPQLFCSSIVLFLVSRFSFIVGSLLPIKVLLIINTLHVPSFFPDFFHKLEFNHLIFFLTFLSIIIYFIHFLSEKILKYLCELSFNATKVSLKKTNLTEGHEFLIKKTYSLTVDFFSYSIFIFLTLGIVLYLHQKLFIFIIVVSLVLTLLIFLFRQIKIINDYLQYINPSTYLIFSNVIFLLSFLFIVYVELYIDSYGILISVVSLLLIRLSSSYCENIINCLKFIEKHHIKVIQLYDL